jgi:hypothetical protein
MPKRSVVGKAGGTEGRDAVSDYWNCGAAVTLFLENPTMQKLSVTQIPGCETMFGCQRNDFGSNVHYRLKITAELEDVASKYQGFG